MAVPNGKPERRHFTTPETKRRIAACIAEFLGTMFFVAVAVGIQANEMHKMNQYSLAHTDLRESSAYVVLLASGYAFAYGALMRMFAPISGGHLNPVITVAAIVSRKVSVSRGLMYIACQICGGLVGSSIYFGLSPDDADSGSRFYGDLGIATQNTSFDSGEAFGIELLCATFISISWLTLIDHNAAPFGRFGSDAGALYITLTYWVCAAVTCRIDGVGLNPIRAFSPAVVTGNLDHLWFYWLGPLMGAMAGALIYQLFDYLAPQQGIWAPIQSQNLK